MNNRSNVMAVISYITWAGFIIALLAGDRRDDFTAMHLNQALVLNIISVIAGVINVIPIIGNIVSGVAAFAIFILSIMGIYRAATWSTEPLPIVGDIHLIA